MTRFTRRAYRKARKHYIDSLIRALDEAHDYAVGGLRAQRRGESTAIYDRFEKEWEAIAMDYQKQAELIVNRARREKGMWK